MDLHLERDSDEPLADRVECGQCVTGLPVGVKRIAGRDIELCELCLGDMADEPPTIPRSPDALRLQASA